MPQTLQIQPTEAQQISWVKYTLITLLAVVFTWLFHEFMHWLTGEALGNNMVMTINSGYPESRQYVSPWHATVVSAAGPIATLVQAIVIYSLIKIRYNLALFPFLLTCLYMRTIAGFLNFINPNDEGRVGVDLGVGKFTLSILVVAFLFYLTYKAISNNGISRKEVIITTLVVMFLSSVLVLFDQAVKITIL
ncbi:hypothetical protein [Hymenobacter coccineus]|uniref:Uncharacterized protein n=1 Tax=Hymenobacter coccineus TaxID=1908235 RepID=A0A1G1TIA9_9BACT|nr:hypothetical protein [Hymenobacter coccineus]OGX90607.1 hypothetical protein BEN49_22195 [Hymenobacter coccineus]